MGVSNCEMGLSHLNAIAMRSIDNDCVFLRTLLGLGNDVGMGTEACGL